MARPLLTSPRSLLAPVTSLLLFLLLGVDSLQPAVAQAPDWRSDRIAELRERLEALRTDRRVPSAQVALIAPDTTVVLNLGTADPATGAPVSDATLFRVGSVSKSLAGVAMMMLVERDLADLDDCVRDLAPEMGIRNPWYTTHPVRVSHLLEASAGFVGFHPEDYEEPAVPPEIPVAQVVEAWPRLDVQWTPGDYTSYHDRGSTITAYLVERITGRSYDDFVREQIFEPLGMTQSGFFRTETIAARLADPPAIRDSGAVAYADYKLWPSGSLNTSAREFSRFVRMLLGRGAFDGERLLRPASVERIETPTTTLAARSGADPGHGINSMTTSYRGTVYHGHPGNTDNYTAAYGYRPESGTGFVFMSTVGESGDWMLWQGIGEVLAFLHPDADPPPARPTSREERAAAVGCFQRLNPWTRSRSLDRVRIRERGETLVLMHEPSGRTATLEGAGVRGSFRISDWRQERAEMTDLVFVSDGDGRLVLQMLDYPFEAYGRISCR